MAAGAAYVFGQATIGATYSNVHFKSLGDTVASGPNPGGYRGNANFKNAEINFKYQLTPALLLGAAFDYTKGQRRGFVHRRQSGREVLARRDRSG